MTRLFSLRFLLFAAALGCSRSPQQSQAQASGVVVSANMQVSQSRQNALTGAVARVSPSVVTVQTEAIEQAPQDPFDWFFGGRPQQRTQAGLGTGFVVSNDGVIVTNAHVVAGATKVSVMMRDGKVFPARVLGQDEANDIAVVKIDSKGLPEVKLGNSNSLAVGEWAIAIGNPFGFYLGNSEPSVSVGVISATQRNLIAPGEGQASYFDMIQTDAAINPGNSGGPLVDADGEVIGVNSSIFSPSGGSVGLGFAIPINRVARVVDDLLSHGSIRSPWIGVRLEQRRSTNPRDIIAQGAIIATVSPGSPAAKAGLQPGDVIMREGARIIHNPFDWQAALLDLHVGSPAQLHVRRGSREFDVSVSVSDLPEVSAPKVNVLREMELVSVTPAIAAERGLRRASGALIYNVSQTIADQTGLQQGDVIVQINNMPIQNAQDVQRAIDASRGRTYLRLMIERQGQLFVTDPFAVR
ncbi:MAG TPA: trypsin-like peptidase domain-containing protein [Gemmatimonadaceae bacterium]|jgi:serine protease Do|nr:trypsin-like peptidase domain-containing protein [Gemmatimonadaceae bacterium]